MIENNLAVMAKNSGFIQPGNILPWVKTWFAKDNYILFLIFLFALFLRTLNLSTLPHAFHTDELISGYIGRFTLLNGKDVYGNILPLFYFDKFGDYRVILPMYISGISTIFFGVNEFAVRFPSAFFGSLMVFPIFMFTRFLLPADKKAALLASFALAVLPWHIVLSRTTSEGVIGLTVFSFAIVFLIKAVYEKKRNFLYISCLLFLSTYFMYPSFRILTPLFFLSMPFLFPNKLIKPFIYGFIFTFFAFTFMVSTTDWGKGRFEQTSLLKNREAAEQIRTKNEMLSFDEGNNSAGTARIFHNKFTGYTKIFAEHYLEYFSLQFLFLKGGLPDRYVVQDTGLVFITFLILLAGILLPVSLKMNNRLFMQVLFLAAISPLPAAVTMDDIPNVHRSLLMIFPISILIGAGAIKIYRFFENRNVAFRIVTFVFLSISLISEFIYFSHQYINHTASFKSFLKNDGYKELMLYVKENKDNYKKIYMPAFETIPIYYLFYTNNFDNAFAGQFKKERKLIIKNIDNIEFITDWCPIKIMKKEEFLPNSIIIEHGDCEIPSEYYEIERIVRSDSTKAFKIVIPRKEM